MKPNLQWPSAGRYILAVSGGADSMVLLDLMTGAAKERGYELTVAHLDHGLRTESAADRRFVQAATASYGLPFEYAEAGLGRASEATARATRYAWLEQIRHHHQAAGVITAHHQDDLIETSLLNLARGSGRRGLAPMQGNAILRPLLGVTRARLRDYAAARHITWREDSTNNDLTNPRNYLRHQLLAAAGATWRRDYLARLNRLAVLNTTIGHTLQKLLDAHRATPTSFIFPHPFVQDLSLAELQELIVAAAQSLWPDVELDQRLIQEIALFARTAQNLRQRPLRKGLNVIVQTEGVHVYYMGISESRLENET
ncbi:MAG: hypothetical protein JWN01_178 [Patescibacteria group bacterium]|nr:hypothetical protein [Patescibacteria group bacterium]